MLWATQPSLVDMVTLDTICEYTRKSWPHRGGFQRREPQKNFLKQKTVGREIAVFLLRIYTIFCMREAVCISDGFRVRAGPQGP